MTESKSDEELVSFLKQCCWVIDICEGESKDIALKEIKNIETELLSRLAKGRAAEELVERIIIETQDGCTIELWDEVINPLLIRYVNENFLKKQSDQLTRKEGGGKNPLKGSRRGTIKGGRP